MTSGTLKTNRAGRTVYVLGVIVSLSLFYNALFPQGEFGRILGTVTDSSGAVIAGAKVSIIDTQRGLAQTRTTDQAGEYNAPTLGLSPAEYASLRWTHLHAGLSRRTQQPASHPVPSRKRSSRSLPSNAVQEKEITKSGGGQAKWLMSEPEA